MASVKKPRSKPAKPRKHTASRNNATAMIEAPNAIRLLKNDHREVEEMFAEYEAVRGAEKKRTIVKEICAALRAHMAIEEEIFYPQARNALKRAGQIIVDEAELEHEGIKMRIAELDKGSPGKGRYDAIVKVLREYVEHHVREEERDFFPKVRRSRLDLDRLGAELAARKEQITGKPVEMPRSLVERGLKALGLEGRHSLH